MPFTPQTLIFAFIGGLLPAFIWLFFWLREDRISPEPRFRIVLTFVAGMAAVFLVLPLETYLYSVSTGTTTLFYWAVAEELFKLGAAFMFGIASADYDEPVDAVIYMVTAALGFTAAENALFLLEPLGQGQIMQSIAVGDVRFVGATLLHTLASATIGLAMAFTFHHAISTRRLALFGGVILAIVLHTLFNFFILSTDDAIVLSVFLTIWVFVIVTLFFVERAKHA